MTDTRHTTELKRSRCFGYLCDLQQYNAVLDGLYHALKRGGRRIQRLGNHLNLQDGRKENEASSDLHKSSL